MSVLEIIRKKEACINIKMWNIKICHILKASGVMSRFFHLNTSYRFLVGELNILIEFNIHPLSEGWRTDSFNWVPCPRTLSRYFTMKLARADNVIMPPFEYPSDESHDIVSFCYVQFSYENVFGWKYWNLVMKEIVLTVDISGDKNQKLWATWSCCSWSCRGRCHCTHCRLVRVRKLWMWPMELWEGWSDFGLVPVYEEVRS